MNTSIEKVKSTVASGPIGAIIGAGAGYCLAKHFGFEKSIPVISFMVVGVLIGASIGYSLKTGNKI